MSAATAYRSNGLRRPIVPPSDDDGQNYGVFLECEDEAIAPILLRPCINRYEAFGWREYWKVDNEVAMKMTVRPIDKNGNATAEETELDSVHE